MPITSGSGFKADRFQHLIRMFDSPYRDEAVTAFNLAMDELKKSQLRFVDQIGNGAEAERAKAECASVRVELKRILKEAASDKAKVSEFEQIIDRLHERIALMEASAEMTPDDEPPPKSRSPELAETESAIPDIPWTVTPQAANDNKPSPWGSSSAPFPNRPSRLASFWSDWMAGWLKFMWPFLAISVLLLLVMHDTTPVLTRGPTPADFVRYAWLISGALLVASIAYQQAGWLGVGFKFCMIANTFVATFFLIFGRDPFTFWFGHHAPFFGPPLFIWPHLDMAVLVGTLGIMGTALMPARMLRAMMENEKVASWVVVPVGGYIGLVLVYSLFAVWEHNPPRSLKPAAATPTTQLTIPPKHHARRKSKLDLQRQSTPRPVLHARNTQGVA